MAEQPVLHVRFIPQAEPAESRLIALIATALDRALAAGVDFSPDKSVHASVGTNR